LKPADIPFDEATRLAKLRSLDILDTAPEERFDRVVRMAQRMFHVPMALVSLVDENRQWFKACVGLDADETSREVSFCAHAILGDEVFIVPDATADERFAENPLVTGDPNIRFYAGCPLRFRGGSKLGTLCLIDTKPRTLDEEEIQMLKDLAATVEHELVSLQVATIDALTGLSNRRGFISHSQHLIELCKNESLPATLIYLDLDDFASINERFGKSEGDDVLVAFASQMQGFFRDSDIVGRVGSDEFAVLLTNVGSKQTEKRIQQFVEKLESYNQAADRDYDVTLSFANVEYNPESYDNVEQMLELASQLLSSQRQA
jgi:diguanylate cyclase (GGDEF)-like protein